MSTSSSLPRMKRVLPGIPWKNQYDKITYIKGVIEYASSNVLFVVTDSKLVGNVNLIGDNYIYSCPKCQSTVYEQEVQMMRQHDIDTGHLPRPARCPFCSQPIERVKTGTKLRLHYRFATDGMSGGWWAERWNW